MKRVPESNLPPSRGSLPAGCSDLVDAYRLQDKSKKARSQFLFEVSVLLHDPVVSHLDRELLLSRDSELVKPRISEILHLIFLSNPELEKATGSSADLVNMLFEVILANLDDDET